MISPLALFREKSTIPGAQAESIKPATITGAVDENLPSIVEINPVWFKPDFELIPNQLRAGESTFIFWWPRNLTLGA